MVRFATTPKSAGSERDTESRPRTSSDINHPEPVSITNTFIGPVGTERPRGDRLPTRSVTPGDERLPPRSVTPRGGQAGITDDEHVMMDQLLQETLSRMTARYQDGGGHLPDGQHHPTGELAQQKGNVKSSLGPRPPLSNEPILPPPRKAHMSPTATIRSSSSNGTTRIPLQTHPPQPRDPSEPPHRELKGASMTSSIDIQRRRQILSNSDRQQKTDLPSPYSGQMRTQIDTSLEAPRQDTISSIPTISSLKQSEDSFSRSQTQRKVTFQLDQEAPSYDYSHREHHNGSSIERTNDILDGRIVHEAANNLEHTRTMSTTQPAPTNRLIRPQSAKAKTSRANNPRTVPAASKRPMSAGRMALRSRTPLRRTDGDEVSTTAPVSERSWSPPRRRPASANHSTPSRASRSELRRSVPEYNTYTRPNHEEDERFPDCENVLGTRQRKSQRYEGNTLLNPSSTHKSLLHNVLLATKPRHQPSDIPRKVSLDKLEKNGLRNDDEEVNRFMCITCHDWACSCRNPHTITRYNVSEGQQSHDSVGPITCSKDYVIPKGCSMTSKPDAASDSGYNQKTNVDMLEVHGGHGQSNQSHSTGHHDPRVLRKIELQRMESFLSRKPVSVKRGFRVSGPHWMSKSHTQSWPWKGTVRLSVRGDQKINTSYISNSNLVSV